MRILHVVTHVDDRASYDGALAVAVTQCAALRRRGHDARIVAGWAGPASSAPTRIDDVPVHVLRARPLRPGGGPGSWWAPGLTGWLRRHRDSFDVAHLHLTRDLIPLQAARELQRLELPYLAQTHATIAPDPRGWVRLLDRRATRAALLGARHVFVLTPDERDAVARVAGTAEGISVLRHGVRLPDRVPPQPHTGPAEVVFMGRLRPGRRVMDVAAAAERLIGDGLDVTFTVIGPDGGDLPRLRRFLSDRPTLAERMQLLGALPRAQALERLRRADLYVLPGTEDTYPTTLLEALAAGVATVCTTSCAIAGTLAREGAAAVTNPTDDALYVAMRRLLVDRAGRAQLAARAALTAGSEFGLADVVDRLEEKYCAGDRSALRTDPRGRMLWVTPQAGPGHLDTWDRLTEATRLTVALLQDEPAARKAPSTTGPDRLDLSDAALAAGVRADGSLSGAAPADGALREAASANVARSDVAAADPLDLERIAREHRDPDGDQLELDGRGYPVVRVATSGPDDAPREVRRMICDRPDVVVLEGDRRRAYDTMTRWAHHSGVPSVRTPEGDPQLTARRASAQALPPVSVDLERGTVAHTGPVDLPRPSRPSIIDLPSDQSAVE